MKQFYQPEDKALVHWTYSKEEWTQFIRTVIRKRSFVRYILLTFSSLFVSKVPVTLISCNQLWIGEKQKINSFIHTIAQIDLVEEGPVNILHITYSKKDRQEIDEIKVLVPKGRLKEAISVQENMLKRQPNP